MLTHQYAKGCSEEWLVLHLNYIFAHVSFEVLTVVTMKIGVFWNEKTCMYIVQ
jgi:hypothetical protein